MTSEAVKCCPHCGGLSGYRNRVIIKQERRRDWAGQLLLSIMPRLGGIIEFKRRYCIDCGKCVSSFLDQPVFKL